VYDQVIFLKLAPLRYELVVAMTHTVSFNGARVLLGHGTQHPHHIVEVWNFWSEVVSDRQSEGDVGGSAQHNDDDQHSTPLCLEHEPQPCWDGGQDGADSVVIYIPSQNAEQRFVGRVHQCVEHGETKVVLLGLDTAEVSHQLLEVTKESDVGEYQLEGKHVQECLVEASPGVLGT
jgi:hypothetical protein